MSTFSVPDTKCFNILTNEVFSITQVLLKIIYSPHSASIGEIYSTVFWLEFEVGAVTGFDK